MPGALGSQRRKLARTHKQGKIPDLVYEAVDAWIDRTERALESPPPFQAKQVARQATYVQETVSQLSRRGNVAEPALLSEARALLGLGNVVPVMLDGIEAVPVTYLLKATDGMAALIFDGLDVAMKGDQRGLVFHEIAHAHPAVDALAGGWRDTSRKRGEPLADLLALSVGGTGYAGAVRRVFDGLGGVAPEHEYAHHPSFALREEVMRSRAGKWWTGPYSGEIEKFLRPLKGRVVDAEARRKVDVDEAHIATTLANCKIPQAQVYKCRMGTGAFPERIRLSAELIP